MRTNNEQLPLLDNFGLVSAWHQEKAVDINRQNHERLKYDLLNLNLSSFELKSHVRFVINHEELAYEERLFFVCNVNPHELMLLGAKYQQTCVVYKDRTGLEVMDTKVGRLVSSIASGPEINLQTIKAAYIRYVKYRNKQIDNIIYAALAKLHIPTRTDSLLRRKERQGLAAADWIDLF